MYRRLIALSVMLMLLSTTAAVMLNEPVSTASAISIGSGSGVTIDGLTYSIVNGAEVQITGYQGQPSSVTIPSTIDGLPVTSIGYCAFKDCYSLRDLTISYNCREHRRWCIPVLLLLVQRDDAGQRQEHRL